jgi:predicted MFS family arabinose efflux permease
MADLLEPTSPVAAASAPARRRGGALAPLRNRNFSLLFSGQLISMLGDQAYSLALPWTVLAVTGDPRKMAIVLAAESVPRALLLLVGGALADRLTPRLVMLTADLGRMLVVGALGVTLFFGLPPLWVVALFAALQGVGSGLFMPGSQALVPATLDEADLPAGNGLMYGLQFLTLTVGPVLGGIATATQATIAFLADAASFGVSALTLFGIRLPKRPHATAQAEEGAQPRQAGMAREIGAGFRYALATPLVRSTMLVTVFGNLGFAGAMNVALFVLARNLSHSPVTLGLILAATGVGGIVGGLGASALGRMRWRGRIALVLFGLDVLLMAAVPVAAGRAGELPIEVSLSATSQVAAVAGVMAVVGLLLALGDTMIITIMQQRIAPEYMARVFSIQFLAGGVSQPISMLGAGALAAAFGPGVVFLAGAGSLAIGITIAAFSKEIRNI